MADLAVRRDGVELSGEEAGEGPAIVLLHGLTATRRYVVMGSRALERDGYRVIGFDARGHGQSGPAASPGAYGYDELVDDLEAILDAAGVERAVLVGASMGAHTALAYALRAPERVAGLVVITPAYDGPQDVARLARWDALAQGLREDGVDGFLAVYGEPHVRPELRRAVTTVIRQRMSLHEHPDAVADALQSLPRSLPFGEVAELSAIDAPTAVVASDDEADPDHPRALGETYAATIPGARLVTDEPGRSPIAWQGSQLSRVIAEVAAQSR